MTQMAIFVVKVKVMVSIRVLFFIAVVISHSKAFLSNLGCRVTRGFAQTRPKIATLNTALFLSTADFKNGMTFEIDGVPVRLQEFLHVKPGKGAAFVRTKVKNLLNGSVQEKTFRAGESIVNADVEKTSMQYTYTNGKMVYFMNMETFEEQSMDKSDIPNVDMLIEGLSCNVCMWNDRVIDVQLPQNIVYTVTTTTPTVKGQQQGSQKEATLNCGARINVPLFIEEGEQILVCTEDRKYVSRVNGKSFA